MKLRIFKGFLATAMALLMTNVQAEDIDLFVGVPAGEESELPNVLFVVDNTANWGNGKDPQPFTNLKSALASTLAGLPVDRFRVGVMLYNETGNPNSNVSGGYVRAAIRTMNETNRNAYIGLVDSLDPTNDKGNGAIGSLVMAEAWRYYSGGAAYAGNNKEKADYTGNTSGTNADNAVYQLHHNALSDFDAAQYNSPLDGNSCSGNYVIYISNGVSTDNTTVKNQSRSMLQQAGGAEALAEIRISPGGLQDNPIDEWSRFMKNSDLDITTYTIEINPGTQNQARNWTAVLESMANEGGGKYFPVSSSGSDSAAADDITDAINRALSEIQSVNSVYASVSLPVSVNTQGTFLNQVFIGMFRPEQGALPRWDGNLKQYRLGRVGTTSELQTVDANGEMAINSSTGFIAECARSYWTPETEDNYWQNLTEEHCIGVPAASNSPDGNVVEKGAQGYVLRGIAPSSRNMFIESSSSTSGLGNLTETSIPAADLGVVTDAERRILLNWLRGFNNNAGDPEDSDGFASADAMRPSVHGDVVHSRPVAINYGTDEDPDVRVFYGANDGLLRAVNGNRNGGSEIWSFLPREFYPDIKRLRDNTQAIDYPGLELLGIDKARKDYGFDGPIVAYQAQATDTTPSKAWIFGGLRRGGRSLYGFDVSVLSADPALLWRVGCLGDDCTEGYTNIGQTWSSPAVVKSANDSSTPLLLMGGGYDNCEDDYPHTCTASSKGNSVYVIDAASGSMLNEFSTQRGVVADVTVVTDEQGDIQYGYTADLAGNVYRLSGPIVTDAGVQPIGNTPPAEWQLTKIASLGCDTTDTSCDRNRKFLHAPDVVLDGNTYFVLVGSGDREKPLGESEDVQNYFYAIKDRPAQPQAEVGIADLTLVTTATPTDDQLEGSRGWRLQLLPGEQVVTSAITVFGVVTFSTHEPASYVTGQCSANLGTARVYNISYRDAATRNDTGERFELIVGGGLPPSPVAGMVRLDDGTRTPFIIGARPDSPLAGAEPVLPDLTSVPRGRVYWNIEEQ